MDPQTVSALVTSVATLLVVVGGVLLIFKGVGTVAKWFLLATFAVVVINELGQRTADWRAWLPNYIDDRIIVYALGAIGFLIAMNILRHILALFVGYGAADSAVGNLLAAVITSAFTIIIWPFRTVRRLLRRSRPWSDDL